MSDEKRRLKFEYVPRLSLESVFVDPENERQTLHEKSFTGLRDSIARRGVTTPIGVELLDDGTYKVVFGNRRVLAAKAGGRKHVPAKVYRDLEFEDRALLQMVENATKVKIPLSETSKSLWEYYLHHLKKRVDKADRIVLESVESYWDIPFSVSRVFSMVDLAEVVGVSEDRIADSFRYIRLHKDIQEMVQEYERRKVSGKKGRTTNVVSFNFAQEFGRIANKADQLRLLRRILAEQRDPEVRDPIKNGDEASKAVTKFLLEKQSEDGNFSLEACTATSVGFDWDSLEKKVNHASKVLSHLGTLLKVNAGFITGTGGFAGDSETTKDRLLKVKGLIRETQERFAEDESYREVLNQIRLGGRSVLDRILCGEFAEVVEGREVLVDSQYKVVSIDLVYEDTTQPRKTFDEAQIRNLAETIRQVGVLSPPLVQDKGDGTYRLIVGHRRTRAAKLVGLNELEVIVCNANDEVCREIQFEEDLFETVILAERAEKLYRLYLLEKERASRIGEDLTVRRFAAKYSSISATTITHAILFASLPPNIKMMHSYGLLNYSTAVAIAEEIKTPEQQLDWAIEASLLGYNAKTLRRKVYESEHQLDFETRYPDLFGGTATRSRGRNVVVSREIKTALEVIPAIEDASKTSKVPRYILHSIASFFNTYEDLQKHFS